MSDDYKPVSCERHSEYELAIMHGQCLSLHWQDENGRLCVEEVSPTDIITRDRAEYLQVKNSNGKQKQIRLDNIIEAYPV